MQECTFHPALVSEQMVGQGRALKLAGSLAHYPAPSDYPDSPDSNKYQVKLLEAHPISVSSFTLVVTSLLGLVFVSCVLCLQQPNCTTCQDHQQLLYELE